MHLKEEELLLNDGMETFAEESIRIGYNIGLLERTTWRIYQDILVPKYNKNHLTCKLLLRLNAMGGKKVVNQLDNIICRKPPLPACDISAYDKTCELTQVFYNHLYPYSEIYSPCHSKARPYPNKLSYNDSIQMLELWTKYKHVMDSCKHYSRYADDNMSNDNALITILSVHEKKNLTSGIKQVEKDLDKLYKLCRPIILIKNFMELDDRWCAEDLYADKSVDELDVMIAGHPSNILDESVGE